MSPPEPELGPSEALRQVAQQTERYVAAGGWDQQVRLFALVPTADLLAREPQLGAAMGPDPGQFTAVEQDGMPPTADLQSLLGRLAWPPAVAGAALVVERIVVPPEAEREVRERHTDDSAALEALATHPARRDVRLLVAVLRDGPAICLLRQREHDSDDRVATGPDLAPGVTAALRATFDS